MKKNVCIIALMLALTLIVAGCTPAEVVPSAAPQAEKPADAAKPAEGGYWTLEELGVTYPLPMDKPNVMPTKVMPEKKVRIAILGWATNPYWVGLQETGAIVKNALENVVKGAEVDWIIIGEDFLVPKHVATIETAMAKQYDVILTPVIDDGTNPILEKAMQQGVTVGTYVCETEGFKKTDRFALFGQNTTTGGEMAGTFINDKLGGKGKVGLITGTFGVGEFDMRINGAKSKLSSEITFVGPYENMDQAEKSYSITKDMLTANPDLGAVYVVSGGPHGACRAIEELGLTGKVLVVGFDATPENIEYLQKGVMSASITDSAFAQLFDLAMASYNFRVTGERPSSREMWTDIYTITPENLKDYLG